MCSPAQGADDVAEPAHRVEGGIERRAADGIVDDIKTLAAGMGRDILLGRCVVVVDRGRAKTLDNSLARGRARRKDLGAKRTRELNGDVTDAASTAMDQYFPPAMNLGAIDQSLPTGDENQRQGCGLPASPPRPLLPPPTRLHTPHF